MVLKTGFTCEDQATDRAFRIGQTRNVFVHKFVTLVTLEERIDQMIEDKKKAGDYPAFWRKDQSFIEIMTEFYGRVRKHGGDAING
jgi:hypothetical protein